MRALGAALLLALVGCEQDQDFTGFGRFENPHDLMLVNGYLFVISSPDDELKVLDTNSFPFDWVPAPNPLQPLSIPLTVSGPTKLVADSDYVLAGDTDLHNRGPYLYAYNPARPKIAVIGTPGVRKTALDTPEQEATAEEALDRRLHFVQVANIDTGGPISALAAQGPGPLTGAPFSTLYFATTGAGGAEIHRVRIPVIVPPADGNYEGAAPVVVPTPEASERVLSLPGEAVTSLAIVERTVAGETGDQLRLAIATRTPTGGGRTFVRDLATGDETVLQFPFPVRQLVSSPRSSNSNRTGIWIFGLMDEASCNSEEACRGILAVNAATGEILHDRAGPMLPIRHGTSSAVTFSIFPDARLRRWQNGARPVVVVPDTKVALLGVVAYATGRLGFFNAQALGAYDGDPTVPRLLAQQHYDPAGNLLGDPCTGDPCFGVFESAIRFSEGATLSEQIAIGYQTPTVVDVPLDPSLPVPSTFTLPADQLALCPPAPDGETFHVEQCPRVRVGDAVTLSGGCSAELTVTAVGEASFETTAPPAGCSGADRFSVRAGSDRPLVVVGTVSGYMGRAQPGELFRYYREHFFRPREPAGDLDYDAIPDNGIDDALEDPDGPAFGGFSATDPALRMTVNPNPDVQRGDRYVIAVEDGVEPMFIALPTSDFRQFERYFTFPSGLDYVYQAGTQNIDSIMVSLPASRLVMEVYAAQVTPNVENIGGTVIEYR